MRIPSARICSSISSSFSKPLCLLWLRRCVSIDKNILTRTTLTTFRAAAYEATPSLVNITEEQNLRFRFNPKYDQEIPKKASMSVNMTLLKFGSSHYSFNIEPCETPGCCCFWNAVIARLHLVHTTRVDFRMENISSTELRVRVNQTGIDDGRWCSARVYHVDHRGKSKRVKVCEHERSLQGHALCFRPLPEQPVRRF